MSAWQAVRDKTTSAQNQASSRADRPDQGDIGRCRVARQLPLALTLGAALAIGIFERVWYLQHDPINSDEALVGILARHLLAGHANAFLLGQPYGGVEPYVVAAIFGAFGSSPITLQVPVVVLDAVACVLVWRVGRRLVRRPAVALVAAAAMWAAPQSAVWNSTLEYGFRGVTLVCGVAMLLLALRITQEDASRLDAPLLGLVAGVGWWSSPEIVYFAVPAVLWLLSWAWHTRRASSTYLRVGVAMIGAGVGALPWLWDNVGVGFPSLAMSRYDAPAHPLPYLTRVSAFVHYSFPMTLDLRVPRSGVFDLPAPVAIVLTVLIGIVIVGSAVWCFLDRTKGAALGCAVLAYPFILAVAPAGADWQSARYTNFFVPLALLLLVVTAGKLVTSARHSRNRQLAWGTSLALASVLGAVLALSVVAFGVWGSITDPAAAHVRAGSPDAPAQELVQALEHHGITAGYADYWVAYKLDFLSDGRLSIADTPPSPDRLPSVRATVRATRARHQGWIFMAPTVAARTEYAPTAVIEGPSGLPEATFIDDLHRLSISSRVLHFAGADVVVCSRAVTLFEVGLR